MRRANPSNGPFHHAMLISAIGSAAALLGACGGDHSNSDEQAQAAQAQVAQGKEIFRFDTFGDETLWTDTLRMHEVIRTTVSPIAALALGLKVDAEALPAAVVAGIQNGSVDLNSPTPRLHC